MTPPSFDSAFWDVFKDENLSLADKKATVLDFDKVLGLGFGARRRNSERWGDLPERQVAREARFQKSDKHEKNKFSSYEIKDTAKDQKISKI